MNPEQSADTVRGESNTPESPVGGRNSAESDSEAQVAGQQKGGNAWEAEEPDVVNQGPADITAHWAVLGCTRCVRDITEESAAAQWPRLVAQHAEHNDGDADA